MAASGLMAGLPVFEKIKGAPGRHPYSQPDLLAILDDAEAVREIGREYRRRFPVHDAAETLGRMFEAETQRSALAGHTPMEKLSRCVQADFAHGRIVQINGWILSITEARQCALFSLLSL